jgi:nucleoside-diphosphate-sugar epimerase
VAVAAFRAGKIVITGAAGLVGQNLVLMLREAGHRDIVAIDKQAANLAFLARVNPGVRTVLADLADRGPWRDEFRGAASAVVLHAQITGKTGAPFERNNITASSHVFEAIADAGVPFTVHVSSSVVNSVADDHYTRTKKRQERLFLDSELAGCVLRPTLMFGWFDPKHFGWLARFMERVPVFPIPGSGRYSRQPLYERDFCRSILWCLDHRPHGEIFDLVGAEHVDYVDIIRTIRDTKGLRTPIVHLPVPLFRLLLRGFSLLSDRPPFTADQLDALMAGDEFTGVDMETTFGFRPTPFRDAIRETFLDPVHSRHVVERTD